MRWAEPDRLPLLWIVPLVLVLAAWAARRRGGLERSLGEPAALRALASDPGSALRAVRTIILAGAAALALVALARPQAGFRLVTTAATGADLVVALDLSHSMEARDVAPDRLVAARREAATLLEALEGSSVGLLGFAGRARIVSPLTSDREGLASILESAGAGDVERPGSDIGAALSLAARYLRRPGERPRAVLLVSDGENLEGDPLPAAAEVRRAGARLYTIGIGTEAGASIPITDSTGAVIGTRRTPEGSPVRTQLHEDLLRELARRGGGHYERGDGSGRAALRVADALRSGGDREVRGQTVRAYDERFPWFAAAAGLLLLVERLIPRRRRTS